MTPRQLAPVNATTGQRKRKEYRLGSEYGNDPEWLKFVSEYLGYVVRRWTTLKSAQVWCDKKRGPFLTLLKEMFAEIPKGNRFWRILSW